MKLRDITSQMNPVLRIVKGNKKIEIPIKINDSVLHKDIKIPYIGIDSSKLKYKGKLISLKFDSKKYDIFLFCVNEGTVFKWDNLKVVTVRQYGKKETFILARNDYGMSCDRRRFKRYSCKGNITIIHKDKSYAGRIIDISMQGIKIETESNNIFSDSEELYIYLKKFDDKIPIKIKRASISNGKQYLGCFVSNEYKVKMAHLIKDSVELPETITKNNKATITNIRKLKNEDVGWSQKTIKRWHN